MKKNPILLFLAALFVSVAPMQGQSLKDLLNSSLVKDVVTAVTDPKVSAADLQGTWTYKKPACELSSDNVLKGAGGSVISSQIENKIEDLCTKAGIREGNFGYTFRADSTFTNTLPKGKPLNGTYSYDPETRTITLKYGKLLKLTTLEAKISKTGDGVAILFNADKLIKLLSLVSSLTKSTTLKAVNSLAEQYDDILLGFELGR